MVDRIIFACTLILAAVYFYATAQISKLAGGDPLGPRAFPYLIGIGLLIAAGVLLVEILEARKNQGPRKTAPEEKQDLRHLLVIGAVVVWSGAYFAVFEMLGYLIATAIYLIAMMAYFNRGKWVGNVLTSVLFCTGSYLLFKEVLGVSLPKGILGF
jgi:putative tricarboxylic transport membrane protein